MSRATTFEKIAASTPRNATAASVTSRGTHYEPVVDLANHQHFDTPPATTPILSESIGTCGDLIGRRFGRFTVIGLAAEGPPNPKKKARWVVRCACGDYEYRKAKSIRNPANSDDMCQKCRHVVDARRRYEREGGMSLAELAERSRPIEATE